MLITNVPHAEEGSRDNSQHYNDHDSLDVNSIPNVSTFSCHGSRDTKEGVKGIPCRMQPPQLTAFFKKAWFYCVFFHSDNPLSHFLYHEVDSLADDCLDVVL